MQAKLDEACEQRHGFALVGAPDDRLADEPNAQETKRLQLESWAREDSQFKAFDRLICLKCELRMPIARHSKDAGVQNPRPRLTDDVERGFELLGERFNQSIRTGSARA